MTKSRTSATLAALGLGLATGLGFVASPAVVHRFSIHPPTAPRALPAVETLLDLRPVSITFTIDWKKVSAQSTVERFARDPFFWRNMHFDDWDRLPSDVRDLGLRRMQARFAAAASGPRLWSTLGADDWDYVPQPVRLVVYPLMVDYWVREYAPGKDYGLTAGDVSPTLRAIVMAESWFEHRAFFENPWGNRDVGLGQCSNRCRRELWAEAAAGQLDFALADAHYFNPWLATRAAVVWFGRELDNARGDIDLAIRAYHRGFKAASRGDGDEYLATVTRLRRKYFSGEPPASATWRALSAWAESARARIQDAMAAGAAAGSLVHDHEGGAPTS
ncbi:MAG TPA: transglycosylase SLT domain-containing protein [Vicinamibacterales bacterium]|nr:transglycosylase SLT domain-containing protein [Vicinamibacterales bacterium]